MKNITPISITLFNRQVNATQIGVSITNDNLSNSAVCFYILYDATGTLYLAQGSVIIDCADYAAIFSNDDYYTKVCSKIGVTLI